MNPAGPLRNGPNVRVLAALPPQGVAALLLLEGAVNAARFAVSLDPVLGPTRVAGDVVGRDTLPLHTADGLAALVAARGACRLFLPPSSPDVAPIELACRKLKTYWRTAQARTREALTAALRAALDGISEDDAKNWVSHGGYHVH